MDANVDPAVVSALAPSMQHVVRSQVIACIHVLAALVFLELDLLIFMIFILMVICRCI